MHDRLTGLPNRLLLLQRLGEAAARAEQAQTSVAVLFANIDRFKQVNDTYGHQAGDDLLVAVASRLSALARPDDTLARVSADEFVFLRENLHGSSDIEDLAASVDDTFATPLLLPSVELTVTASV